MKKIWFIRHGESASNAGEVTNDPHSTPLTEVGQQQAQIVAQTFAEPPKLIVTSPYVRTHQTAAPLRERFPEAAHEEWQVEELGYITPEKYAGTTGKDRVPWIYAFMTNTDPDFVDGEGAESFNDMLNRVAVMREKLLESEAQSIAVFTHGAYLRIFLWQWLLGAPRAAEHKGNFGPFLMSVSVPNCCIIEGRLDKGNLFLGQISVDHLPQDLQT